ncbi:MAG: lysylphosphatidylglycerol synthase transmembrane domain-containing protein [Natrialbaceae archaeon]|nr:lysylphosphatidylglycerol synthase transmembrane domain-containing protein [Natrialbaceae archaeon]
MLDRKQGLIVISSLGAVGLLLLVVEIAGVDRVLRAVLAADRSLVVLVFLIGLGWLLAWSTMLRSVLATLDVELTRGRSFLLFSGAVFAHNVTPFGQAGGEPVPAMIISRASDTPYETGLAGIASVDLLNVIPSLSLDRGWCQLLRATASLGTRVELAVVTAFGLVGGAGIVLIGLWRGRYRVQERLPRLLARGGGRLGLESPESIERGLTNRLIRLIGNLERVASNRRHLVSSLTFSLLGWLLQAVALSLAFAAVGHTVSPHLFIFVIPLAYVAGVAPLPGGLGGIEAALVALLVPTTGLAVSAITAAVLIFRGAIFWMPIALGSLVVWSYGIRSVW